MNYHFDILTQLNTRFKLSWGGKKKKLGIQVKSLLYLCHLQQLVLCFWVVKLK